MPIINKPFTFVAGTPKTGEASQVNADMDALYGLVNGGLDNTNLSATANIQQNKIFNLVQDLLNRVLKTGDTMTGNLHINVAQPTLLLEDSTSGGTEFAIQSAGNQIIFYANTGTHAAPVYTRRYALRFDGLVNETDDLTTKLYVDAVANNIASILTPAIARVFKTDGDFVTGVDSVFTPVTGLSVAMTTRARWMLISVVAVMVADSAPAYINLAIDNVEVSGAFGLSSVPLGNFKYNASFTYMTQVPAGNHVFEVRIRTESAGSAALIYANANQPAVLSVIEQSV